MNKHWISIGNVSRKFTSKIDGLGVVGLAVGDIVERTEKTTNMERLGNGVKIRAFQKYKQGKEHNERLVVHPATPRLLEWELSCKEARVF